MLVQMTNIDIDRLKFERAQALLVREDLARAKVCKYGRNISFHAIAQKPEYREIDVKISVPRFKRQTGILESEHKPAGEVGAAVFNAAAGGGCAVGAVAGSVVPILGNIVGCIVGAAAGAGIGLGAGAATTAIMTNDHNENQAGAFNAAYDREEALQKTQIQEVNDWLKTHPVGEVALRDWAEKICLTRSDWSAFEEIDRKIDGVLQKADKMIADLAGFHAGDEIALQSLRATAEMERQGLANAKAYIQRFDDQVALLLKNLSGCSLDEACIVELELQIREELRIMESKWMSPQYQSHPKILERKQQVEDSIRTARGL
jgi:hypothetical protein